MPGGPNRVAVVTGAGSGIGLATAGLLAREGYAVALAGRRPQPLETAADAIRRAGGVAVASPCDIGAPGAARALIADVVTRWARIDALVNNAGVAPLLPIDQHDEATMADTFAANALGPANAISAAWPVMTRQKRGVIVNVSTAATRSPFPGFFAYAASKAAVNLMAKSCAKEGAPFNIRAFSVAPGATETAMLRAMFDEKQIPRDRCLAPEAVARVIGACIRGERDADNGETIYLSA